MYWEVIANHTKGVFKVDQIYALISMGHSGSKWVLCHDLKNYQDLNILLE